MINGCVYINNPEVLALKEKSGLSDYTVELYCQHYLDNYNRMPYLDELPKADSEKYLRSALELNDNNATEFSKLVAMTGAETVPEINAKMNDELRDLEVLVMRLNKEAIVNIEHRPTAKKVERSYVGEVNNKVFWDETCSKLARVYGIEIIPTTNHDLLTGEMSKLIPNATETNAFIYNNQIYINTDVASVDAPLHELMHIFLGSMRFLNPELYVNLINLVEKLPGYNAYANKFENRTKNDLNEEIFVTAFSKYLTGMESHFDNLPDNVFNDIFYNIYRTLDSMLMGESSARVLNKSELVNSSLKTIAEKVNSVMMSNAFRGTIDEAMEHRIMANKKSELMKEGRLQEIC